MEGMKGLVMCLRWSTLRRRRILMTIVMVTVMIGMMVSQQTRTMMWKREAVEYKPFIPDHPDQIRIGKPANIPQRFLIEEADACVRKGDDVEMVVYVHSAISRVEQRRLTRLTWANSTAVNMVVVFMVGRAKNEQEREIIRHESELYHDIVQGDYADHYHLLSYKALASLYWITRNCAHVPWTLHSDDDLLIDTFVLQDFIQELDNSPDRDKLHCRVLDKQRVFRKGRWKVSRKELPYRRYPPFCQGFVWLLSTKEVPKLLGAASSVKFLWVDDAYITGLLSKKAGMKISPIDSNRFGFGSYSDKDLGKKVVWFHIRKQNLTKLWSGILDYHNVTGAS